MKIWIVNPYGNIPGEGWRDYRSTMIANAFIAEGHEVVWWISNFEHRSKKFRTESFTEVLVVPKYVIKIIPSTKYNKHISLARIKYERNFAKNFVIHALEEKSKPDIIIICEPAIFYSDIFLRLTKKLEIPFIIDIIDIWPELFYIIFPNKFIKFSRLLFSPLILRRLSFFKKANGIIAVSKDYLEIAKAKTITKFKEVVYWGVDNIAFQNITQSDNGFDFFTYRKETSTETWLIYAGTLGDNYDIASILKSALEIERAGLKIKIFLAGDGPLSLTITNFIKSNDLKNIIFLGRLNVDHLNYVYSKCDVALSCYVKNSTVSMPIKAYDYLCAGLPIINSIERELGEIVRESRIGIQYEAGDFKDMVRAIITLSSDQEMLLEMKKNALLLGSKFNSKTQYLKVVKLATDILNNLNENS